MSSLFDFDDSQDLAYNAKTAGKAIVNAKHAALQRVGEFIFLAHSEKEFALRCQMVDNHINEVALDKLANVSDSKGKLVRAMFAEWQMRHARCQDYLCKTAIYDNNLYDNSNNYNNQLHGQSSDTHPQVDIYIPREEKKHEVGCNCGRCTAERMMEKKYRKEDAHSASRIAVPVNTEEVETFPYDPETSRMTRKVDTKSTGTAKCDGCGYELDRETSYTYTPDEKGESVQRVQIPSKGTSAPGGEFEKDQELGPRGTSFPQVQTTKQKTLCRTCAEKHLRGEDKAPGTTASVRSINPNDPNQNRGNCIGVNGEGGCGRMTGHTSMHAAHAGRFQCGECEKRTSTSGLTSTPNNPPAFPVVNGDGKTLLSSKGDLDQSDVIADANRMQTEQLDKHNFGDRTGTCVNCGETTGHGHPDFMCPPGAGCQQ